MLRASVTRPGALAHPGRPRSEPARRAVLHAVDDLLVEQGYAAMTMKGIAERAGVGRQTVYRWWSNKAEILMEASAVDARHELAVAPGTSPPQLLAEYVRRLVAFLTASPAGLSYRALLGQAQHDPQVAALLAADDVLTQTASVVVDEARAQFPGMPPGSLATLQLVGPILYAALSRPLGTLDSLADAHTAALVRAWR